MLDWAERPNATAGCGSESRLPLEPSGEALLQALPVGGAHGHAGSAGGDGDEAPLRAGVDPALIELEITENMVMHGEEETLAILDQLHGLGVRIGVDDFGSGYSSLSYLKRFPIDTLKIDRSFVKDIGKDETDNAIVNAIVVMGHSLGLAVVAEGVETREQAMALESFGCDIQQGYLHGRPMSPEAFAERLAVGQLTILEEWMGEFSYRAADHHGPHHPLAGVQGEGGPDPAGRPTAP